MYNTTSSNNTPPSPTTSGKDNMVLPPAIHAEATAPVWKELEPIYDEMRDRNRGTIEQAKAMREDGFFRDNRARSDDDRRCLAISAILDESVDAQWSPAYKALNQVLQTEFPDDLHFGQRPVPNKVDGQLHWTVMQLVGFNEYDEECSSEETKFQQEEYLDCIQDSLTAGGLDSHLTIHYVGVIAVATGLLMIGVPSIDTNDVRDRLRSRLEARGLPLKEPFVNNIVHSTLFRVTNDQPQLYSRLLEIAQEYEMADLGHVCIKSFQIGPASWRMLDSEVTATPSWRTWEVNEKTAAQVHLDRIGDAGADRSIQTVSGATGAKLAQELKNALAEQRKQQAINESDEEKSQSSADTPTSSGSSNNNNRTVSGVAGVQLAQELRMALNQQQQQQSMGIMETFHQKMLVCNTSDLFVQP